MKIKRVQIKNFRSLAEVDCTLSKVNFVLGANNVGKSSFVNAVEYALANTCTFSGKLQDLRRTKGGNSFDGVAVASEIEDFGNIMRYCKSGAQINRFAGEQMPDSKLQELISNKFGYNYSTLEIMFDANKFTSMTPKEQKAFLLKLTGIHLNADTIISYMDNPSENAKNKVRSTITREISIDDFDSFYKKFYAERGSEKKRLNEVNKRRIGLESTLPKEEVLDEESIKNALTQIKKDIEKVNELLVLANERTTRKNLLLEKIETGKKNIEIAKGRINKEFSCESTRIEEIKKAIIELEKEKNADNREVGACKEAISRFLALKNKLNTDKCPLSEKLVCNANKQPLLDEFDKQIKEYETKEKTLKAKIEKIDNDIAKLREEENKVNYNIQHIVFLNNNEPLLKQREEELKALVIPDITKEKEKKVLLEKDLEEKNKMLETINRIRLLKNDIEKVKKEENSIKDIVDLYEYLVKEFEPNGIRSRILKKIIEPLQIAAKKEMGVLATGATLSFNIDGDGFEVLIENETGIVPLEQLSASEQLRAQIVIQDIVNRLTGVGLLVVDEASMLDKNNFNKLIELINEIEGSYGTIFIAITSTKEELQENASVMLSCCKGDSSIFWVEDGTITKV